MLFQIKQLSSGVNTLPGSTITGDTCQYWSAEGRNVRGGRPTSTAMREMLEREGIPETTIWTEERSRSTHENAAYGAEVLRSHGISTIALVVEAQSMLGAEACFRKQGITVVPAASGYREWGSVVLDARLDIVYVGVERSTPVTPTAPTRRPATLAEAPCIPKGWLTCRQPPPLADRHAG